MGQTTSSPAVPPPATSATTPPPTTRLRIAVPVKQGFTAFVKITDNGNNGGKNFSGFAIDVFRAVASTALPKSVTFDFIPFAKPDGTMNGTYDDMLLAVQAKDYDGAVGDTIIRYYRRQWVEFTTPYSDSGLGMLVRLRQPSSTKKAAGISLLPLLKRLIIAALAVFLITALVFCILDYIKKNDTGGQARNGVSETQVMHRETMRAIRDTRVVMVLWFAVLLLLTTCYVASLTSLLTAERPRVPAKNLNQLLHNGDNVGYSRTSFIRNYLTSEKRFPENKLMPFDSEKDMQDLLSKGTANGGVAAVIHGTPHLQLFLAQHSCDEYHLVPNINFQTGGFGFAFQTNSPWTEVVSDGILKLVDNGQLAKIQDRTIGNLASCQDDTGRVGSNILVDSATPSIIIAGIACFAFVLAILYAVYFAKTFKQS